jgi:hypothetical protein
MTDLKSPAIVNLSLPICKKKANEPPRGKPRGIFQGIFSILPQQAAGNSTLKEIKCLNRISAII